MSIATDDGAGVPVVGLADPEPPVVVGTASVEHAPVIPSTARNLHFKYRSLAALRMTITV